MGPPDTGFGICEYGTKEEALKALKKVLEINPTLKEAKQLLRILESKNQREIILD